MINNKRERLPDTRPSITHKGHHGKMEFYVTVGFYDHVDKFATPAEVFVKVAKQGSDISIFVDGWAIMVSRSLQHGDPWNDIKVKFTDYPHPNLLQAITLAIDSCVRCVRLRQTIVGDLTE